MNLQLIYGRLKRRQTLEKRAKQLILVMEARKRQAQTHQSRPTLGREGSWSSIHHTPISLRTPYHPFS